MRSRLGVALSALLVLGAVGELDTNDVLSRLQSWLDGTRELECLFRQSLLSGALGAGLSETGRLYLERPGRMRWDYLDPELKTAVLDGGEAYIYVPEDAQLIRSSGPPEESPLYALLSGGGRLVDLFEAFLLATPRMGGEGAYRIRLVPRSADEEFREVTVEVSPPDFAIESAEVLDAAGNRIRYEFSSVRRNRGIPPQIFRVEVPPGTEVVDQ